MTDHLSNHHRQTLTHLLDHQHAGNIHWREVRSLLEAVGEVEEELHGFARRCVQATRAIRAGEVLEEGHNIAILRPGSRTSGVHPRELPRLSGRPASRDIDAGEGIREGDWT